MLQQHQVQCILCSTSLDLHAFEEAKRKYWSLPHEKPSFPTSGQAPGSGDSTGLEVLNGERGSRIEELGSAAMSIQLRHVNRLSYGPWCGRVSVTAYPPLGAEARCRASWGASSPLLHGMIRPQQRRGLATHLFYISPRRGTHPTFIQDGPSLLSPPDRRCFVYSFLLDCWPISTPSPLLQLLLLVATTADLPPLLLDIAVRERHTTLYYLAS